MAQWHYTRGEQQEGPIDEQALKAMLSSGEIALTEMVWREGMDSWQPASEVKEFAALVPPARPAHGGGVAPGGYPPPAGFAPPGYGAPVYGAPGQPLNYGGYYGSGGGRVPEGPPPPSHLVGAILSTLFCCLPLGVIAIVYAAQVDSKWQSGDYAGANDASAKASTWMWWSVGSTVVVMVLYIFLGIAAGM